MILRGVFRENPEPRHGARESPSVPSQKLSRPIIVLGAPRTGTSLACQLLNGWGAQAGPDERLAGADPGNPRGYWEYRPLIRFQMELLEAVGAAPWHDRTGPALAALAADPAWRERALALVAEMNASADVWYWKYPLYALLRGFWAAILPDPVYVVTLRDPEDTARSNERYYMPAALAAQLTTRAGMRLLWQGYMTAILELVAPARHALFIDCRRLLADPRAECERLCGFLDGCYEIARSEEQRSQRVEAMAGSVDPALWDRDALGDAGPDGATPEQRALYAALLERCHADAFRDAAAFVPPPMRREDREYLDALYALQRLHRRLEQNERTLASRAVRSALAARRALARWTRRFR